MPNIARQYKAAIEDVAKEGKLTYIFDSSMGSILYADENENEIDEYEIVDNVSEDELDEDNTNYNQ